MALVFLEAMIQGFTGAGLFGRLRRPGAPTEFIDSRTPEEYIASGEFEATLRRYRVHVPQRPRQQELFVFGPDAPKDIHDAEHTAGGR
jgi:hypothetical protein